jgi:hypothetical protein
MFDTTFLLLVQVGGCNAELDKSLFNCQSDGTTTSPQPYVSPVRGVEFVQLSIPSLFVSLLLFACFFL